MFNNLQVKTISNPSLLTYCKNYSKPKYIEFIEFIEFFYNLGFEVGFYRAKTTVSKYVFVKKGDKEIKIRFSNHLPNLLKEEQKDSDYYVGRKHNGKWISSEEIKKLVLKEFSI